MKILEQVDKAVEGFYNAKGFLPRRVFMPAAAFERMWEEAYGLTKEEVPKAFVCPLTGQVVREETKSQEEKLAESKQGYRVFNYVTPLGEIPIVPSSTLFMHLEE